MRWERYAAGAGVVGAAIFVIQAFVVTPAPTVGDPIDVVARYYVTHARGVQVQVFLTGIAAIFFLWFLGSLIAHLGAAGSSGGRLSTAAFGAAIASIAPVALGTIAAAVLALEAGRVGDTVPMMMTTEHPGAGLIFAPVIRVLADTRWLAYTASWFALAPFAAAVAALSMRTGAFPRWHANFGYGVFFLGILTALGVFARTGPLAPGNGLSYIAFLAFLAWIAAASGLLVQMTAVPAASSPPPAEAPTEVQEGPRS